MRPIALGLVLALTLVATALADEPTSNPPGPNRVDEPVAEDFSLDRATRFLDDVATDWTTSRKCFTCHTNYLYLVARPLVSPDADAHREVRAALEELVQRRWAAQGPRWDAEVVMSAAVLALNDAATTGKLHEATRQALDRMWTVQREDGGVAWLKCGWPPMESDDDFGATVMALAVGAAPGGYRQTEAARNGFARLRAYFKQHPGPTLHHRAMLLWADSYLGDLLTADERQDVAQKLLDAQNDDGGWRLTSLGDWKRSDGSEQDMRHSDGYGTGFVVYVLRRTGVPADHPKLQAGVAWLKSHQRISGRWYTRSLATDNLHYLSHAGSAFAVMALTACEPDSSATQKE